MMFSSRFLYFDEEFVENDESVITAPEGEVTIRLWVEAFRSTENITKNNCQATKNYADVQKYIVSEEIPHQCAHNK